MHHLFGPARPSTVRPGLRDPREGTGGNAALFCLDPPQFPNLEPTGETADLFGNGGGRGAPPEPKR